MGATVIWDSPVATWDSDTTTWDGFSAVIPDEKYQVANIGGADSRSTVRQQTAAATTADSRAAVTTAFQVVVDQTTNANWRE
jgi:hypothetical protein